MSELLVSPEWLADRLQDPGVRIVDASWYLGEPERGRAEYTRSHLPGAIYLDLATDLADTSAALRNTMAAPQQLAETFGRAGIADHHHVVVYDRLGGYSAGRVWWALRYAGGERASLLDGGYPLWVAQNRPTSAELPRHAPIEFKLQARPQMLRGMADVLRIVESGGAQLVDARSEARFRGEGEETARHRGHIPGSVNVPYGRNLCGDPPQLCPLDDLRRAYEQAGVDLSRPIVTTCGSGVTAALDAFALTLLGCPDVSVYDGSWAEWGNADDVPIHPSR